MIKVEVSGDIEAPSGEVWKLAGNFSGLDRFVEAITGCVTDGSGVGAVRTLYLQDGGKVEERLESLDNDQKKMTYSILESPMPIENYTGTIEVKEIDKARSKFYWSSMFNAPDQAVHDMQNALEELYKLGLEGLRKYF